MRFARVVMLLVPALVALLAVGRDAQARVTRWEKKMAPSPGARNGAAVTWADHKTVIFGGRRGGMLSSDTWAWNGTAWTQIGPPGGQPGLERVHAAMAHDGLSFLRYGGTDGSILAPGTVYDDTYLFINGAWALATNSGPGKRSGHAMVYVRGVGIVLVGGSPIMPKTDTWVWNGSVWSQYVPGGAPTGRGFHAMTYDPGNQEIVVYGGLDQSLKATNETWTLDVHPNTSTPLGPWHHRCGGTKPACGVLGGRFDHAIVYDTLLPGVALFGGTNLTTRFNDVWLWNRTTNVWDPALDKSTAQPNPRELSAVAFDQDRSRVVVYAGVGPNSQNLPDTWEMHFSGQTCPAGANGRCHSGNCVDEVRCETASCGVCQQCDQTPAVLSVNTNVVQERDGLCRVAWGKNPNDVCGPRDKPCSGTCTLQGKCRYPGPERKCGKCIACDATGKCTQPPANWEDVDWLCPEAPCSVLSDADHPFTDVRIRRCKAGGKAGECGGFHWRDCNCFGVQATGHPCKDLCE